MISEGIFKIQCNLDLVTLNLVTTCDLVTILQRPFFNLLHKIIRFSDIMWFSDSFWDWDCTVLIVNYDMKMNSSAGFQNVDWTRVVILV